jgi:hypothetical protein
VRQQTNKQGKQSTTLNKGEGVKLLAWVGNGGAHGCVEAGAGGRHGLGSGGLAVEHLVTFGNVECNGVLGSRGLNAHQVMV